MSATVSRSPPSESGQDICSLFHQHSGGERSPGQLGRQVAGGKAREEHVVTTAGAWSTARTDRCVRETGLGTWPAAWCEPGWGLTIGLPGHWPRGALAGLKARSARPAPGTLSAQATLTGDTAQGGVGWGHVTRPGQQVALRSCGRLRVSCEAGGADCWTGQDPGCDPGVPGSFLKRLGSDRGRQRLGGPPQSCGVQVLSPPGPSGGNGGWALAENQGFSGREGGQRGRPCRLRGRGPPCGHPPGDRTGPSPWPASQVWGHAGLNPCPNPPGGPYRPGGPTTAPKPDASCSQPILFPQPRSQRARVSPCAGWRPPLLQPLCLCDPGGTECGNGAGGRGHKGWGGAGSAATAPLPAAPESAVGCQDGRRSAGPGRAQVPAAPGSGHGWAGGCPAVPLTPPGPGALCSQLPLPEASLGGRPPPQPCCVLGACEPVARGLASPNCRLLSGPTPSPPGDPAAGTA